MHTNMVALERVHSAHARGLEQALQECETWRCPYLPMPKPGFVSEQIEQWQQEDVQRGSETYVQRWLSAAADQQIVGMTRLFALNKLHRRAQVGSTWLVPRAQRQGVNRHAKWLIIRHGFETLHLARLEFVVQPQNTVSMQALEAIGAQREGLLRNYIRMNGQMHNVWMYALTREDWLSLPFRASLAHESADA